MVSPHVPEEPLEVWERVSRRHTIPIEQAKVSEDSVQVLVGQKGLDDVGSVEAVHAVGAEHAALLAVLS